MQSPPWLTARISHLDLTLAWAACRDAYSGGKGAITRTAIMWDVAPSIVQKALDRVEAALGGQFFVTRVKRSGRLTERGERFVVASTHFFGRLVCDARGGRRRQWSAQHVEIGGSNIENLTTPSSAAAASPYEPLMPRQVS